MLMIDGAAQVSRADLAATPLPAETRSWKPLAHGLVAETLVRRVTERGLRIRSEQWALTSGALYPAKGVRVELKGARCFGNLDLEPIPGTNFPQGCIPSIGLRNSTDKSYALSILAGARVLICSNGILSAEHVVKRRHTSGIDLDEAIDEALDAFLKSMNGFTEIYDRLRSKRLTITRAQSLAVDAARAGAYSSASVLPVVEQYLNPRHDEFRERTAWSLYNSATEIMKRQSPARQVEGFKALNSVILAAAN